MFVAAAGRTGGGRGGRGATGPLGTLLRSFAVGGGLSGFLGGLRLRFGLPAGLHGGALRGRRRPRGLGGACVAGTFGGAALLAGADPVAQLPIHMLGCRTGELSDKHPGQRKKKKKKTSCCDWLGVKLTSAFAELLPGHAGGSSAALSPSESDLELLSESLELGDSGPPECGALNELRKQTRASRSASRRCDLSLTCFSGLPLTVRSSAGSAGRNLRPAAHASLE